MALIKINNNSIVSTAVPSFLAFRNSSQAIANTTAVTIKWDSEVYDNTSAYNPSTGFFTPQVAGTYVVGMQFAFNSADDFEGIEATIFKNTGSNVEISRKMYRNENFESVTATSQVTLDGNDDYVWWRIYQASGGSKDMKTGLGNSFGFAYKIIGV